MNSDQPPNIVSFVIRFIHADSPELANPLEEKVALPGEPLYRGTIRHIQTDQELAFTRWSDAEEFIRRFVPIELGD